MDKFMGSKSNDVDIQIKWERASNVFSKFQHLFNQHYKEIFNKEMEVKEDTILLLEENGALFLLAAYHGEVPIGYYSTIVVPNIYNPEEVEVRDLGIYVLPEFRGRGITTAMQPVMDSRLRGMGADSIVVSYPSSSTIPLRDGYELKEYVYRKEL